METSETTPLYEIINSVDLGADELYIIGGREETVSVHDPTKPKGEDWREGDNFAVLPNELTNSLPGSVLLADEFVTRLGEQESITQELEGNYEYDKEKGAVLEHEEDNFKLKVYNGSTNANALRLSELAIKDFEEDQVRADYQRTASQIAEPVLKDKSEYDARIVEDVIASGETIAGVLAVLKQKGKLKVKDELAMEQEEESKKRLTVRIDVISATTQGLLVLRKFAKDNGITLDIRVGYLAYGLSEGIKIEGSTARQHANYVTYPKEFLERMDKTTRQKLENLKSNDGNVYVVGDMGDAFKSLPDEFDEKCPWNKFRHDDEHGSKSNDVPEASRKPEERYKATTYYFANGGYFMRALMRLWGLDIDEEEIMLSAKRVWTDEDIKVDETVFDGTAGSYGVLVKELKEESD